MISIPFFIFTRFGVGCQTPSFFDFWLDLFQAVTFPSVMGQTDNDFHWLIFIGQDIPAPARDRLLGIIDGDPRIHLSVVDVTSLSAAQVGAWAWMGPGFFELALGKGLIEDIGEFIITVQIDSDDAWHLDTIKNIRATGRAVLPDILQTEAAKATVMVCCSGAVLTFGRGYTWYPGNGTVEETHECFRSMSVFVLSRFLSGVYNYSADHDTWDQRAQTAEFRRTQIAVDQPMWIYTRHDANLSRDKNDRFTGSQSDDGILEQFGINRTAVEALLRRNGTAPEAVTTPHMIGRLQHARTDIGLEIVILDSFSNWTRRYDETGGAIALYRSDPARAWSACRARFIQLFDGKLWKCPSVAYLPLIPPEHMRDIEAQAIFKTYRPLEADADHREIQDFLGRREEHVCSCCPEMIETFQPGSPMPPSRDGRNYDDDDRV